MWSMPILAGLAGFAIGGIALLFGFNRRVAESAERLWMPGDIWVGASMLREAQLAHAGLTPPRTRVFGGFEWTGCLHLSAAGLRWEPFKLSRWMFRADPWFLSVEDIREIFVSESQMVGRHECHLVVFTASGSQLSIRVYSHGEKLINALRDARVPYSTNSPWTPLGDA